MSSELQVVGRNGIAVTEDTDEHEFAVETVVDDSSIEVHSGQLRVKPLGLTDAHVAAANKDGLVGVASMRTLGTGAQQAAAGTAPAAAQAAAIAAAATDATTKANAAQAAAVQRGNHTGTQLLATISDAGNAAGKNVGTGANDVAAGNAPAAAQAAAVQRGNHTGTQLLATISDAGNAAGKNVGTGSNDVAAGNAPAAAQAAAIAAAATDATTKANAAQAAATAAAQATSCQRASNLTDLTDYAGARAHLGLGTVATLNVPALGNAGIGEVVKGDDSRLVDERVDSTARSAAAAAQAAADAAQTAASNAQSSADAAYGRMINGQTMLDGSGQASIYLGSSVAAVCANFMAGGATPTGILTIQDTGGGNWMIASTAGAGDSGLNVCWIASK